MQEVGTFVSVLQMALLRLHNNVGRLASVTPVGGQARNPLTELPSKASAIPAT